MSFYDSQYNYSLDQSSAKCVYVWALQPKQQWLTTLAPGQCVTFDAANFEGVRVYRLDVGQPLTLQLPCPDESYFCSKIFTVDRDDEETGQFFVVSILLASATETSLDELIASATASFDFYCYPAEVFAFLPRADAKVDGGCVKIVP